MREMWKADAGYRWRRHVGDSSLRSGVFVWEQVILLVEECGKFVLCLWLLKSSKVGMEWIIFPCKKMECFFSVVVLLFNWICKLENLNVIIGD